MVNPIYANHRDNILLGAVITGTAPASGYLLSDLGLLDPAQRVLWGVSTVTMTWTLISPKAGGVLVVPMHGFDPGTGVVSLTNGAGLNHAVTVPALQIDGFPPILIVDFSGDSNLTSNVWNLVVTSNSRNMEMGTAVAIYPKKTFQSLTLNGGVSVQFKDSETPNVSDVPNEYDSHFIQDYGTTSNQVQTTFFATEDNADTIRDWFRAGRGRAIPSFLQWDTTRTGKAIFGHWGKTFERSVLSGTGTKRSISAVIDQFSRGLVI